MSVASRKLIVSSSPHITSSNRTKDIMFDVMMALVPAMVMAVVVFGFGALILTMTCVASSVFFEWASRKLMRRESTIGDLSAVVTGILLSFNLPSTLPLWMAAIGCFVAIVIVKQIFGGLGQNFANPAIVGRIVLLISFAVPMTTWTVDGITGATPLGAFAAGEAVPENLNMFLGFIGGSMGEVSGAALLLGGLYLVYKKVIAPTIPLAFIGTVALFALAVGEDPIFHICAGGVMLGAIFMATDYVTSPITTKGKLIFAVGCGFLTMVIRLYSSYPEGVSFAILLMNIISPHIDRCTILPLNGVNRKGVGKS